MHDSKPIIGITFSDRIYESTPAWHTAEAYVQAVEAQGAAVRLLTPAGPPAALSEVHGVLLAGGVDVAPERYGQPRHPDLGEVDEGRDRLEFDLIEAAAPAGVPLFGICRGIQVLGVAFGGTLHQHIPATVPGALGHSPPAGETARHRVRLVAGTRLREIVGQDEMEVNSYHHQAVAALGGRLRLAAESEDGVVEAVEGGGEGFVLGVQWHPERMLADAAQERLFAAFAAAAADFAAHR